MTPKALGRQTKSQTKACLACPQMEEAALAEETAWILKASPLSGSNNKKELLCALSAKQPSRGRRRKAIKEKINCAEDNVAGRQIA